MIVSCVAAVISMATATFAFSSSRSARRASSLPVLAGLLAEYRASSFKEDERWVRDELVGRTSDELNPEEWDRATRVSHFYDNIGLLVATGAADEKPLLAFLGDAAERTFWDLWPLIEDVRARHGEYQVYFEDFVALAIACPPADLRSRARRIPEAEKNRRVAERQRERAALATKNAPERAT